MNQLPEYKQLNIAALSRVFDDMSESYKVFWFNGIMDEVKVGNKIFTFRDVINHMVTAAWYMVSEYHLNLGPADTLEKLVSKASLLSGLAPNSKPSEIIQFTNSGNDKDIKSYLKTLTLNVPYRLQSTFVPELKGEAWHSQKRVIETINSCDNVPYHFGSGNGLNTEIIINDEWFEYLFANQTIIDGWINYKLIDYLQRRNPNVPGIINKLTPPSERNLENAKKYWKAIIELTAVSNIYAPEELLSKDDVSIDHFVPWSYVSHDELWNLVPTTKSLNSSKSNNLPNWDKFFPQLCKIEYISNQSIWNNTAVHSLFDKCAKSHLNSEDIKYNLYRKDIGFAEFSKRLEEIILPAYNAAKNVGFSEWNI